MPLNYNFGSHFLCLCCYLKWIHLPFVQSLSPQRILTPQPLMATQPTNDISHHRNWWNEAQIFFYAFSILLGHFLHSSWLKFVLATELWKSKSNTLTGVLSCRWCHTCAIVLYIWPERDTLQGPHAVFHCLFFAHKFYQLCMWRAVFPPWVSFISRLQTWRTTIKTLNTPIPIKFCAGICRLITFLHLVNVLCLALLVICPMGLENVSVILAR